MTTPRSMLKAAALLAPLGALTLNMHAGRAEAADIVGTLQEQQQFSTLVKAIGSAGIEESLQGEGPYTVFAPTNEAFDQLPEGTLDELMKQENQGQLKTLVQYHVVEGEEISAKDALGKQNQVTTLAGDSLSINGVGQMVLLVPAGLSTGQQDETQVSQEGDMPASEHQEQVLAGQPDTEQQQTMAQDGEMPSSPHQEQVLSGEQDTQQQAATTQDQQAETEAQVSQEGDVPASEHQQQVLATQPATEEQQTTSQDSGMPSSPHQEQVLKGQQPGEDTAILREAAVVEPDIRADNGIIHAVDAVLVPQSVLSRIAEERDQGKQSMLDQGQQDDEQG